MRRETSAGLTNHLKKLEKTHQIKVEMLPQASKILKLDEAVVNRIAAGEIIQRPSNAVKVYYFNIRCPFVHDCRNL